MKELTDDYLFGDGKEYGTGCGDGYGDGEGHGNWFGNGFGRGYGYGSGYAYEDGDGGGKLKLI